VLITGGAGFLGAHLVSRFQADGVRVRVLDVQAWANADGPPPDDDVRADVRDPVAVAEACRDVDVVVHAAFASPHRSREALRSVNVDGARNVLEAARTRGVRRLVLISSTIVDWPARTHPLLPDSPLARLDEYRATRVEAERSAIESGRRGLSVAIVRPKTFIGPGGTSAFALVFELIRHGRSVPVLGDGRNRYQLLDIRDLADGIRALAETDAGGVFCFGAERFGTVREDLEALVAYAGTGARLRFIPGPAARLVVRAVELGGAMPLSEWHRTGARGEDSIVDTSRAERELGWRPVRSNRQALADAYAWYARSVTTTRTARRTHRLPLAHRGLERLSRLWPR
jgi:nucleoside-diphosphate-sugar epimerase